MKNRRLLVMKFGGTSLGDAACFRNCARIVSQAAAQDRVIVVVSAMAGVTDLTFRAIDAARQGEIAAVEAHLRKFDSLHRELAGELFSGDRLVTTVQRSDGRIAINSFTPGSTVIPSPSANSMSSMRFNSPPGSRSGRSMATLSMARRP